jgi:hypothetical protein
MKHLIFSLLLILLLAACQTHPVTTPSASTAIPLGVVPSKSANVSNGIRTPVLPNATTPPTLTALHSSSSDPNAGNLVVVRDQPVVKNSLTIDSITAAKSGWIMLYLDKDGSPGHYICYVPVPAGKSSQFAIALDQGSNIIINPATLPGHLIDVVLQTGTKAPGKPVNENGKMVMVRFMVTSIITP